MHAAKRQLLETVEPGDDETPVPHSTLASTRAGRLFKIAHNISPPSAGGAPNFVLLGSPQIWLR